MSLIPIHSLPSSSSFFPQLFFSLTSSHTCLYFTTSPQKQKRCAKIVAWVASQCFCLCKEPVLAIPAWCSLQPGKSAPENPPIFQGLGIVAGWEAWKNMLCSTWVPSFNSRKPFASSYNAIVLLWWRHLPAPWAASGICWDRRLFKHWFSTTY